jgi:hypothetical protein
MISEAKLAANRRNSIKGGVKTREGKLKSRRNALKHGQRAEVILPEDLQAEADARFHQLVDEIRPEGTIEVGLARRMAFELTKLERLEREEHAALAARIREAGEAFDDQQRRRVEACVALLPQQPARSVRGLLGFTAGCNWLLAAWEELRARLESGAWDERDSRRARLLLGGREVDAEGPTLAACLADEAAAVESERDAVWEELDGPLRQEAEDRALLNTSPEGAKRQRYEGQAVRQLHKVIDQFSRNRQGWFQPRPHARSRSAPNEPTAEVLRPEPVASPLPPSPPRGEGRDEGRDHGACVISQAPAPPADSEMTPGGVRPSPRPSPRGGEGEVAANEPTAEIKAEPQVTIQPLDAVASIRREVFAATATPPPPLFSEGIRVR